LNNHGNSGSGISRLGLKTCFETSFS